MVTKHSRMIMICTQIIAYLLFHPKTPPNSLEEMKVMDAVWQQMLQQVFPTDSSQSFHCNNIKHH